MVVLTSLLLVGAGLSGLVHEGAGTIGDPAHGIAVMQAQDTSRPPIPHSFTYPADTTLWAAPPPTAPSDTLVRYYRTIIGIRFDDSTSGVTVRRVLQQHGAAIIGGLPFVGEYIVRVPDPGPTFDALANLIGAISHEPGVDYAAGVTFRNVVQPVPIEVTVVPQQQDTSRPPVPATPNLPDDSTVTVLSSGNVRYYRNIVEVTFDDSVSGRTVRALLAKYSAVIIGGSEIRDELTYYIRIPDPGQTWAAVDSVSSLIEKEHGVKRVGNPTWRGLVRIH